jgi:hypothetical protein
VLVPSLRTGNWLTRSKKLQKEAYYYHIYYYYYYYYARSTNASTNISNNKQLRVAVNSSYWLAVLFGWWENRASDMSSSSFFGI